MGWMTLHPGAYYRPHVGDEHSFLQLEKSLERLGMRPNQSVILASDFNFPGWDWENTIVKNGCQFANLHHKFGDMLDDQGLSQLVTDPT